MGYDKFKLSKDKYKIKELQFITKEGEQGEMTIEILKVDDKKVCVDFTKTDGDALVFYKEFGNLKDYLGDIADATY
jgi:hypothetical protein